jgi:hypothetical protein
MTRKLASAGLALSVIWAVISLVVKGGVGISRADGVLAFNITRANVDITHETANVCLNSSSFVSCQSGGAPFLCAFGFKCGFGNSFDSDSYDITANLTLFNSTEFQQDLHNDIQFALAPGNCSSFASTDDLSMAPLGTWTGNIPGGSLHKVINKNFTIYNFEGNIAAFTTGLNPELNVTQVFGGPTVFDHLEFNLKIPGPGKTGSTTMSLEGNANLCAITGPMALAVFIPNSDDFSCVTIPRPEFGTLDISSGVCVVIF